MILSYNYWNARLYNSCFLAGYLCECITKELCVVKADVGDDRKDGGYDVGTIESSSKSNFAFLLYKAYHVVFADGFPVYADSFTEVYEMRRGIKSNLIAIRLKNGCYCV